MDNLSAGEMLRYLRGVNNTVWGRYAFSFDMLHNRIPLQQQDEMARKAIVCGDEWARRIMSQTQVSDSGSLLESLGLVLVENDASMVNSSRPLFAQFVLDRRIEIMKEPIDIYSSLYQKETGSYAPFFPTPAEVRGLLMAHEIFHYIEECYSKEIYTRTETIRLWKFLFINWDSTVRALSEIAAMSFAKTLTRANYSPFILDFALLYGYKKKKAESVFQRIVNISENVEQVQKKLL
jgi:hypothetical protein